jgi:hypothetical protein
MYATCTLPVGSPNRWQPFTKSSIELNGSTAPKKKGSHPNPQHADWLIHGSVPSFSSTTDIEAVGKSQSSIGNKLHWFTGHISPVCDQYVQYLLTTANPSVLKWHRRGLQPWRCWFSTSHSPPFPTDGPPLSPSGPARSYVNNLNISL